MKVKKKLEKFLLLLIIFFTNITFGSDEIKLDKKDVIKQIKSLSNIELEDLLLNRSDLLGGKCKLYYHTIGPVIYSLQWENNGQTLTETFGIRTPSVSSCAFSGKGNDFTCEDNETIGYSVTEDQMSKALVEMSKKFISLIDKNWPCGGEPGFITKNFNSYQSIKENKLLFTVNDENLITCFLDLDDDSFRNPNTCEIKKIFQELPKETCHLLHKVARNQLKKSIGPMSNEIRSSMIASEIKKNDHKAFWAINKDMPSCLEFFIPKVVWNLIEILREEKFFYNLSDEFQVEIMAAYVSVNVNSKRSDNLQFCKNDSKRIFQAISSYAENWFKNNPEKVYKFFIPTLTQVRSSQLELYSQWNEKLGITSGSSIDKCNFFDSFSFQWSPYEKFKWDIETLEENVKKELK